MPDFVVNVQVAVVRNGKFLFIVRGGGVSFLSGVKGLPGGKTEHNEVVDRVLEDTGIREVNEETGVVVARDLVYVRSSSFSANGRYAVNAVFMGKWESGEPYAKSPDEVADYMWLSAEDAVSDTNIPEWEKLSVQQAEQLRRKLGW